MAMNIEIDLNDLNDRISALEHKLNSICNVIGKHRNKSAEDTLNETYHIISMS